MHKARSFARGCRYLYYYKLEEIGLATGAPMSAARRRWRRALLVVSTTAYLERKGHGGAAAADGDAPAPVSFARGSALLLFGSKINLLLLFVPVAFAADGDAAVFSFACLALLPLAALLGEATERVAYWTNETVGGLLNATFGNATELIVAFFALKKGLLNVVQVSMYELTARAAAPPDPQDARRQPTPRAHMAEETRPPPTREPGLSPGL